MAPSVPPEEIAQLMRFIAEKAKNVKYPMNITGLVTQFKEEIGSKISESGLKYRIEKFCHGIHVMKEFDMETKVKMMFALSSPIDDGFLIEMKEAADVEVDDKQRIVKYKQKDEKLELNRLKAPRRKKLSESSLEIDETIIQLLVEKSFAVDTPMVDAYFLEEVKAILGCPDGKESLEQRYARLKRTIYRLPGIHTNTRIKMMFISNAKLSDDILEELFQDAYLEVDCERRLTTYKANDGSLELERDHGRLAAISKGRKRASDSVMNFDTNSNERYVYFDFDQPYYEEYMEHIPVEKEPVNLIKVEIEAPEGSSTSNFEYHYEDNSEHNLTGPKPEIFE